MDLVIYFTRYIHKEPVKMLSICYHELMGKTEEHEGKKCFMVDDQMLGKVIHKIKEIIGIDNLMILKY